MENGLGELYMSLPKMDSEVLYIRGYTEALTCVSGVRIFPSFDFIEGVPVKFRRYFMTVRMPCYYIPIKQGIKHFGFILKGSDKMTSRFSTYYPFFNLDALLDPRPYVFVTEGIKDAGIFLLAGYPAMAMLTSGISEDKLGVFEEAGKTPVFVPDNDEAGRKGIGQMVRHLMKRQLPSFVVNPIGHKDMGDFFDCPEKYDLVEKTYVRAVRVAESISQSTFLPKPAMTRQATRS